MNTLLCFRQRACLALALAGLFVTLPARAADDGDSFEATKKTRPKIEAKFPEGARVFRLRPGDSIQVFSCQKKTLLLTDHEEEAFYLPPEAREMLQLLIEKDGRKRTYFVKSHNVGTTVGGVVKREWLNVDGHDPLDEAHEARIIAAIKAKPVFFVVEQKEAPTSDNPSP